MSKKINILYVIDWFHRTGGTERHLAHLVRCLSSELFSCRIVVFDLGPNPLIDEIRNAGVPVIHLPVGREYSPSALLQATALSRIIRENKIDIVQTFHQKSDTYGAVVAKLSGVKHIISSKRDIAGFKKPRHFFLNRILRGLFKKVIVVADAVGKIVMEKEGFEPVRLVRIYNGVDLERFRPPTNEESRKERGRLGFGLDDLIVGMVAGFRPEKSHDIFFQGALAAMNAFPSLRLLVVGDGPLLQHFQSLYGVGDEASRITFTGDVADVARYLKVMDIACLIPGMNEGFSNSVIEKMATGIPMVVSDVGGNAEAVIDGENGIVIPPNDAGALCNALVRLCASPDLRRQMGRKARHLAEDEFTLQKMCKLHEDLYLSLMQQ